MQCNGLHAIFTLTLRIIVRIAAWASQDACAVRDKLKVLGGRLCPAE